MNDPNIIYGGDLEGSQMPDYVSLGDMIVDNLKRSGNKKFLINGLTDEAQTFTDILENSVKVAKALNYYGINENDTVSIISENRHEFISITYGVIYLNAVVAPVNCTYTEREIKHALNLSKPKIIFASMYSILNVVSVCEELPFVKLIVLLDENDEDLGKNTINFKEFVQNGNKSSFDVYRNVKQEVNVNNKTAVIFLSSGTTGNPKGVEITQNNIMAIILFSHVNLHIYKKIDSRLAALVIAPWFHVLGFVHATLSIVLGEGYYVFMAQFDPEMYLRNIEKYKISVITVAPPIVVFLAKTSLFHKYDLSSLKTVYSGAAPLTQGTEEELKKRFKAKLQIIQGYGMSETTYGILSSFEEQKSGSVGRVLGACYAKVIDENGNSLGPNKRGELCFKGSRIMKGYLNDPEATAETIDKDGWLHTGDIGYYDDDMQFFIVDRLKELIKYKGFQVAPAELEGLLLSNPKINDAGVIGIPDEIAGELPFAFVVKQPGVELSEKEVKDFVAKNVSNTKWLRGGVKFIDEIPKTPSGKILRKELRELFKSMRSKL